MGWRDKKDVQRAQRSTFPTAQVESLEFWNAKVPGKPRPGLLGQEEWTLQGILEEGVDSEPFPGYTLSAVARY